MMTRLCVLLFLLYCTGILSIIKEFLLQYTYLCWMGISLIDQRVFWGFFWLSGFVQPSCICPVVQEGL